MTILAKTLAGLLACSFLTGPRLLHAATEVNGIAAVVNNKPITRSEVRNAAQMQVQLLLMQGKISSQAAFEARVREIESSALQDLIDRELILDEFNELGAQIRNQNIDEAVDRFIRERFDNDRQKFLGELKNNGLTIQQFRQIQEENIIIQAMRSRNSGASDAAIVTPFEIQEFYRTNQNLFAEDGFVKLRTITVPKLIDGDAGSAPAQFNLVEEIRSKLRGGADFGSMARMYSVDSGKTSNGERGTFAKSDLHASLSDAAFSIPLQTVSDVIDLGEFYTLIYIDARDLGKVAPLSEIEEEVRTRVLQNKRQEKVEQWLTRLRRDANIRVFE